MMKNRKIKILFLNEKLVGGGKERAIVNLIRHLNKEFDVSLALLEKKGFFLNKVSKDIKVIALMKKDRIKNENFITRTIRYVQRFCGVCRRMLSEKPEIVVCASRVFDPMAILTKLLLLRKTKIVVWLHDYPSLHNSIFEKIVIGPLLKHLDKTISPCNTVADAFSKNFGVSRDKICVIPNILEIEKIYELKNEKIYDDWFKKCNLNIISAGHLESRKGFDCLIKAFKIVIEKGINANLIILGEGVNRKNLEILVKNLALENYVILPGFKENPYKYIKNSDVFVLPSINEAFPYVVLEAMACKVPVITTKYPPSKDIITNNINGILVPIGDEKALADEIIELLKNKEKAKRLTENAIKKVEELEVKKIVDEYKKIFVECLSSG